MFNVSEMWKATHPGAAVGILAMHNVANPERHAMLDGRKAELENELRSRFSGYDRTTLRALPVLRAYHRYYKRFKKTYHVQLQLESIVFRNKQIPRVAALVEAVFMAELKDQMLTAGHDLEIIQEPVSIDMADGSERYVRINGQEQQLKRGDMAISDAEGVISSVLYGPDQRTRIRPVTQRVLFTAYAPPGIGEELVRAHLRNIQANILLVAPGATVEAMAVYGTG